MSLFRKHDPTRRAHDHRHLHGADPRDGPPEPGMAFDPVCNMWLHPRTAAASSTHDGRSVHFCASGCKTAFDADPAKFAARLP